MTAILRDATPGDAPGIAAIWNPIIRDTVITFWPTERGLPEIRDLISNRQAAGHAFLVAELDGRVAGFATYAQFRAGAGYARSMEHSISIAPDLHGAGLGRRLIDALHDHARERGHRIMVAAITGSNQGSVAFHRRVGYVQNGTIPDAGWKFGRFHDLVLMSFDLTAPATAQATNA